MKKINRLSLIWVTMAFFVGAISCTNLNETVYDTIPADQFGKKPTEINKYINHDLLHISTLYIEKR